MVFLSSSTFWYYSLSLYSQRKRIESSFAQTTHECVVASVQFVKKPLFGHAETVNSRDSRTSSDISCLTSTDRYWSTARCSFLWTARNWKNYVGEIRHSSRETWWSGANLSKTVLVKGRKWCETHFGWRESGRWQFFSLTKWRWFDQTMPVKFGPRIADFPGWQKQNEPKVRSKFQRLRDQKISHYLYGSRNAQNQTRSSPHLLNWNTT